MLQESLSMSSSHLSEEMREVEEELEHDSSQHDTQNPRGTTIPLEDLEEGKLGNGDTALRPRSASPRPGAPRAGSPKIALSFPLSGGGPKPKRSWHEDLREGVRNTIQLLTSPVFAQAFVLTFLGEWGDRSQITTIAMGGAHVSWVVRRLEAVADEIRAYRSLRSGRYWGTDCVRLVRSWADDISRPKYQ